MLNTEEWNKDQLLTPENFSAKEIEKVVVQTAEFLKKLDQAVLAIGVNPSSGKIEYTPQSVLISEHAPNQISETYQKIRQKFHERNTVYYQKVKTLSGVLDAKVVNGAVVVTYDSSKTIRPNVTVGVNFEVRTRSEHYQAADRYSGLIVIDINPQNRLDGVSATTSLQHELRHQNVAWMDFVMSHELNGQFATVVRATRSSYLYYLDHEGNEIGDQFADLDGLQIFHHDRPLYEGTLGREYSTAHDHRNMLYQSVYLDELHSSFLQLKSSWFRADKDVYHKLRSGKHWEIIGNSVRDQEISQEFASLMQSVYLVKMHLIGEMEKQLVHSDPEKQLKMKKIMADFEDTFFSIGSLTGTARSVNQAFTFCLPIWEHFIATYPNLFTLNQEAFQHILTTWKDGKAAFPNTMVYLSEVSDKNVF